MWHSVAGGTLLCMWYSLLLGTHTSHSSHTSHTSHLLLSLLCTHSLDTSTPPSPCCSSPWPRHTCSHPSWSGCQNICRAVSVVKIFSTGCTHTGRSRRGRNSIGIVCGLSADKWVSDPSLWMPGESATTTTQGPRTPAEYVVLDRRNLSAYLS